MTNLFKANFGYNMQTLMKFGIDFTNMIKKNSNNRFWKDALQCWRTIIDVQEGNCDIMFNEHIWYNPNIKIDNKSVFFKDLFKSGFIYIGDLYENDDQMFSYNKLKNRFNLKTNFVQYLGLTKSLQNYVKVLNKQLTKNCNIGYPNTVQISCISKKGCTDMYNLLISKKITYPKSETNGCQNSN